MLIDDCIHSVVKSCWYLSGPNEIWDKWITEVPVSIPKSTLARLTQYLWLLSALLTPPPS